MALLFQISHTPTSFPRLLSDKTSYEIPVTKTICIADGLDWSLVHFRGELIKALVARGNRVCTLVPGYTPEASAWLKAAGADLYEVALDRTNMNPFRDIAYLLSLRRVLLKTRADFLLSYTIKPCIWGSIAAGICGVKSISTVTGLGYCFIDNLDGSLPFPNRLVRWIVRILYRTSTRFNYRVIFQNPDDCTDFVAHGCISDTSKVRLVNGSGVDLMHYTPAPLPESPSFLMISRLMKNKGVREYVEAALALKARYPEVPFRIIGWVDTGADAIPRATVDEWIARGLEYLPTEKDVRPVIAASQVVVLPSYREGTPRAVLEAMAMGRPIITSDAPGCRQTVEDGVTGFLVPVRDVHILKSRMEWIIHNQDKVARMAQASLARSHDLYDVRKVVSAIIKHAGL